MAIEHYKGNNLQQYMAEYPNQMIVQTRTLSDLMITARNQSGKESRPVFIPKTLPTDLLRQTSLESLMRSEDFTSLVRREVILLVVPNDSLNKYLSAADSRLRAIQGRDKLELASADQLRTLEPTEQDQMVIPAHVDTLIGRLNQIYGGNTDYGTVEEADALLLEASLSYTEAQKRHVRQNLKHPDAIARVWEE